MILLIFEKTLELAFLDIQALAPNLITVFWIHFVFPFISLFFLFNIIKKGFLFFSGRRRIFTLFCKLHLMNAVNLPNLGNVLFAFYSLQLSKSLAFFYNDKVRWEDVDKGKQFK